MTYNYYTPSRRNLLRSLVIRTAMLLIQTSFSFFMLCRQVHLFEMNLAFTSADFNMIIFTFGDITAIILKLSHLSQLILYPNIIRHFMVFSDRYDVRKCIKNVFLLQRFDKLSKPPEPYQPNLVSIKCFCRIYSTKNQVSIKNRPYFPKALL